ncbi:MAG TPA: hypothetical protein PLE19_00455 [Planctomycetota bacterium]|nr:hypothetical protein [Planctomycetota bacterium]HRT96686.1 hypothetical protein [Planctomycetota bacterium]
MDARKQNDPCGGVLALPSTVRLDAPGATAPATRSRALSAAEEAAENNSHAERERRVILHAMRVSLWVWPAFALLDVYMCLVLYPGAPLLLFAAYRAAIEAVLYAVYRIVRRRSAPLRVLRALERGAFFLAAFVIALMAIHLGGLRSAYMHGISLVCLVHAAVMPHPWRQSLVSFLPIGLIFPVVMGVAAAVSPSERAEWYSLESLAIFASHYVFVAASAVVGLASGHAVWTAQQQLYRARKLGRYRLQAPIGAGGMGEVWLAWDGVLRRNVALKFLRVGGPLTRELVRRFEREARAASQLRGPHTARIFDFGASDDGICYIVMEYLAGADLHALV